MWKALMIAVAAVASPAVAQETPSTQPVAPATGPAAALVGVGETDVRARLGQPDVARREGQGAMWTYRRTACSVFVFFQERPGEGLRVSSVSAGPRSLGDAAPSLDVCLAPTPAA